MTAKRVTGLVVLALGLLVLSCAAHQPPPEGTDLPGFWLGIWHGIIAPVALIVGIFNDVRMYAFPNSGGWYDFGFLIGISIWGGGGASAAKGNRRS
jgi:hypothetical protein